MSADMEGSVEACTPEKHLGRLGRLGSFDWVRTSAADAGWMRLPAVVGSPKSPEFVQDPRLARCCPSWLQSGSMAGGN
jgi:hypothetical protein